MHLTSFVQFPDPAMVEALARSGLDSLLFDMQHGMYDERAVLSGVAAAALEGKPALVRVPVDAAGLTSRMLDFGAAGVVAPMINSVADAERLVGYLRFPPAGRRSWGPRRGQTITGLGPADYLARANDLTLAIAMIETREALAALDAILAVPGLDGVFVGPADLSVSLSAGAARQPGGGGGDGPCGGADPGGGQDRRHLRHQPADGRRLPPARLRPHCADAGCGVPPAGRQCRGGGSQVAGGAEPGLKPPSSGTTLRPSGSRRQRRSASNPSEVPRQRTTHVAASLTPHRGERGRAPPGRPGIIAQRQKPRRTVRMFFAHDGPSRIARFLL